MFVLKLYGIQKNVCDFMHNLAICLHNSGIILSEVLLINFPFLNLNLICTHKGDTQIWYGQF